jgi:tetratricopeptide (TPR) repeat protein
VGLGNAGSKWLHSRIIFPWEIPEAVKLSRSLPTPEENQSRNFLSKTPTFSKDYHKKALEIHKELNDSIGLASDYANIGLALRKMGNHKEAFESVSKGLAILQEFEKKTSYHHPLIEQFQPHIAWLNKILRKT